MCPTAASGVASAEAGFGADADANVGVGASEYYGKSDGIGLSGVAPPEDKTPPCGDSLFRLPRSVGTSILNSRAAV